MTTDECALCGEDVKVIEYLAPDAASPLRVELDPEQVEFFIKQGGRWTRGYAYRRHRFTCEAAPPPDASTTSGGSTEKTPDPSLDTPCVCGRALRDHVAMDEAGIAACGSFREARA